MILVTGGTGIVGAHLLLKCVKQNSKVVATYRREEGLKKIKTLLAIGMSSIGINANQNTGIKKIEKGIRINFNASSMEDNLLRRYSK